MIQGLPLVILISFTLLSYVFNYDFSLSTCSNTAHQQSPINIVSSESQFYDEKYFRFLSNNYDILTTGNEWSYFPEERAIGVTMNKNQTNLGSFIFVKDWAMYSFNLQKILFRVGSEHQINGEEFDAEMQFVHTIDPNYYAPGRRVNLGVSYLVLSILFKKTEDTNPGRSKLFEFMNLEAYKNGTIPAEMSRNIKLHYIVQHQPAYLYQGSLTYPECQPALWMVQSQYHLISNTDLSHLKDVIANKISTGFANEKTNERNIQPKIGTTVVYRNWNEPEVMTPKPTLMGYNSSSFVNIGYVTLISLVFMAFMIIF